jgi:hypothetical protein
MQFNALSRKSHATRKVEWGNHGRVTVEGSLRLLSDSIVEATWITGGGERSLAGGENRSQPTV